jgi:dihydrodipicolinate synthase/N-acetylneuraminate lyase
MTAMANLFSPFLRQVWNIFIQGGEAFLAQEELNLRRRVIDRYHPFPAILKAMLARLYAFERWPVRPPLLPVSTQIEETCLQELRECEKPEPE